MRTTVLVLLAGLVAAVLVAIGCGGEEVFCYEVDEEVVCVSADESVGETTQAKTVTKSDCTSCHGLRRPPARARYDALAALGQLWH